VASCAALRRCGLIPSSRYCKSSRRGSAAAYRFSRIEPHSLRLRRVDPVGRRRGTLWTFGSGSECTMLSSFDMHIVEPLNWQANGTI
jgi:hypothetical protein